ncbi:D-2-hydroxyacid dehydrogenase [bacterium]|nr:D-2-hydroxyacid dehydrogenase [bacterium]
MKMVVLDGFALNPGDLSWEKFEQLGELIVYDRSSEKQILERAKDAQILLTNKTVLNREILSQLSSLLYIGVLATGVNVVDTEYAAEKGIVVTSVRNYSGLSAAQMVFALLLELTNRVGHHSETVNDGKWSKSEDFCYWDYPLVELDGLTMGVVGYGGIGQAVAGMSRAFGMKVLINTRRKPDNLMDGVEYTDLDSLFKNSDVITLLCPLTPETKGMINQSSLGKMKTSSFLINISRGALIIEEDLAVALNNDQIAGAALDVLKSEPADPNCPLLGAKNCYITPHIAWATRASRNRLMDLAIENLQAFLDRVPQNTA